MTPPRLTFTLLSDGSSDETLLPILRWLLRQCCPDGEIDGSRFDPWKVPKPARDLSGRIVQACRTYPCDILFVHRDAENEPPEKRRGEIEEALESIGTERAFADIDFSEVVCVIPVRMTEAWLLFNETAIRKAADNPNGSVPLELPPLSRIEKLPDPKIELREILKTASESTGRRKDRFQRDLSRRVRRIAELIEDFEPLRQLSAFRTLEADLRTKIEQLSS